MKTRFLILTIGLASFSLRAQLVADGTTNILSNVTNNITGDVIVGTNTPFTLLVLCENTLLTNSLSGVSGLNTTAKSNEVQLISSSARWFMGSVLYVGSNGAFNRLIVSNGALLQNQVGTVGQGTSSSNNVALITGSGSLWSNRLDLTVGNQGPGNQLIVSNGGWVANRYGYVARSIGSSNNFALVSGSGSVWSNQFDLTMGFGGRSNRMVIEAGGLVTCDNGYIGDLGSSNNEVLVTGSGSLWSNQTTVVVGHNNTIVNRLVVSNGAAIWAGTGIGGLNGTSNQVLITGTGSLWTNQSTFNVGGTFSRLDINNGGWLANGDSLVGVSNTVTLTGAGSGWNNRGVLQLGYFSDGNTLIANSGAIVLSSNALIGATSSFGNNNIALLSDPGTLWSNRMDLTLGNFGAGNRLVLTNGAMLITSNTFLAFNASSRSNLAIVTGPGSYWSNMSRVNIGNSGAGNFIMVTNGGLVSDLNAIVGENASSSNNTVLVTGPNSAWTNLEDFVIGDFANSNRLVVESGGLVLSENGSIGVVGNGNQALVTGPGSRWLSASDFYVGYASNANQLVISNGAVVQDINASVGDQFSATNNLVWVTGSGSVWSNLNQVAVGNFGSTNRLVITNGGMVFAGSNVFIGKGGAISRSSSVVVQGGTLIAANPFGTSTLDVRRGTNLLNAGLIDVDQLVLTNSQGAFVFNGGTLVTRGANINNTFFIVGVSNNNPTAVWDLRTNSIPHTLSVPLFVGYFSSFSQMLVTNGASLSSGQGIIGFNVGANSNSVVLSGAGSQWSSPAPLVVGYDGGGNQLVIRNSAHLNTGGGLLGNNAGRNNSVSVTDSGSLWNNTGAVNVGFATSGNLLSIGNGGTVLAPQCVMGGASSGTNNQVQVTGPGSSLSLTGDLSIGAAAPTNRLIISNGGYVASSNGFLGTLAGASNNVAIIDGSGSSWSNAATLFVGSSGSSNFMMVTNGGQVSDFDGVVGSNLSSSNNLVIVTGTHSAWTNLPGGFYVGSFGNSNRVVIENGGVIAGDAGGLGGNGNGNQALVTGPGSRWLTTFDFYVGYSSNANQLVVSNGAVVQDNVGSLGDQNPCSNNVALVTGLGSLWSNADRLNVGNFGSRSRVLVTNAGTVFAGTNIFVGAGLTSRSNQLVVDGGFLLASNATGTAALDVRSGTNFLNSGRIDVDQLRLTNTQGFFEFGGGTLVTRGAFISNSRPFQVGKQGPTPAIWHVSAGASHVVDQVIIGPDNSFNQLIITNGGSLTNSSIAVLGQSGFGRFNTATIAGPGSLWFQLNGIIVGDQGSGNRLAVTNGGTVINSSSTLIGNDQGASNNQALIYGPAVAWSCDSEIIVGARGHHNSLFIGNGAQVSSGFGVIGDVFTSTSNNLATITDPGTSWKVRESLTVGFHGTGNELVVSNNALVTVGTSAFIGSTANLDNNRLTVDGAILRVTNDVQGALLEIVRGSNVLNAGLIEADIVRMTNAPHGTLQINGGTFSMKNSAIASGTILNFGDGMSPATMVLVGNGTHDFNGNLLVKISSNAVLTGNGTLLGGFSSLPGSTLSPGLSVGKMTFNSLTPHGTTRMELSKNGTALTNDVVQVNTGPLTYDGTLVVSNLGPSSLANGDKFRLFAAPAYAGSFSSLILPPLPAGLTWLNKLLVDGSIEVSAPPAIPMSVLAFSGEPGGARTYSQNFDSLFSGNVDNPWRDNLTLPGWYAAKSIAPISITNYIIDDGDTPSGSLYSYGLTGNTNRALGSIASDSLGTIAYGLSLSNDTASSMGGFKITYAGEQWRDAADFAVTNALTVWYRVNSSAITNPEPGVAANWNQITNLSFGSPIVLGTGTALNGYEAPNRLIFSSVVIPGLVVQPGQAVFFRWHDLNDTGGDQGMALDDLSIVFSPFAPQITSIASDPLNGFAQIIGQGESDVTYGIEAASNLASPIFWESIGSNTANNSGIFQFTDTNAPSFPIRFYRARLP